MDVFAYSLRGMGYSLTPTIVSLCGVCGVRIIWIYTFFAMPELHNLQGLAISYPVSWVITFLVHFVGFCVLFRKREQAALLRSEQVAAE